MNKSEFKIQRALGTLPHMYVVQKPLAGSSVKFQYHVVIDTYFVLTPLPELFVPVVTADREHLGMLPLKLSSSTNFGVYQPLIDSMTIALEGLIAVRRQELYDWIEGQLDE